MVRIVTQGPPEVWDSREFRVKYADSSVKILRIAWLGGINAEVREEGDVSSWEVHGSITREVHLHEGEQSLEMPALTMLVHQGEGFDVTNSQPGKLKDVLARYERDLDTVRTKIKDSVWCAVTSDLPTVESLINGLPGVVDVTGP